MVANRLSADARNTVLLLEAGPASHPWSRIPIGYARLLTNPAANWLYTLGARGQHQRPQAPGPARQAARRLQRDQRHGIRARPGAGLRHLGADGQPGLELRRASCPSSSAWKAMRAATSAFAAATGRCASPTPSRATRSFAALIQAAGEVGIAHNPDYNGARQDGIAMSQATIASRRRMSTARCYLDPIRKRGNLRIETGALTESLLLEGKRCVGVRYSVGGTAREAARRARGRGERRLDQFPATARAVGHRPAGAPAEARHRGAPRPAGRRRESARPLCAAHTLGDRRQGHHLQRHRPRGRPRAPGAALCALRAGPAGRRGGADARFRPLARRPRRAGPAAGLGADADRARPEGPAGSPASRA